MVTVSLVIPVYAGEAYLERLLAEVKRVRDGWRSAGGPLELVEAILVDDSAIDGSPALIDRLAREAAWIVPLHLARNSGQHPATVAGILHAVGDWVVTLDEDLQHPPANIEDMLRYAVASASDIVYAKPEGAVHGSSFRDLSSRFYKATIGWLSGNPHIRYANSFRLIRGSVARGAASACSHETYFDVALAWFTDRIVALPMKLEDERYRSRRSSGYSFRALISHARRLLVSSHLKILRGASILGLAAVLISLCVGFFLFVYKLFVPGAFDVQGWTSLILAVIFFNGLLLLLVGIVLEYLSFLMQQAHGKPIFFVIDRSPDVEVRNFFLDGE